MNMKTRTTPKSSAPATTIPVTSPPSHLRSTGAYSGEYQRGKGRASYPIAPGESKRGRQSRPGQQRPYAGRRARSFASWAQALRLRRRNGAPRHATGVNPRPQDALGATDLAQGECRCSLALGGRGRAGAAQSPHCGGKRPQPGGEMGRPSESRLRVTRVSVR